MKYHNLQPARTVREMPNFAQDLVNPFLYGRVWVDSPVTRLKVPAPRNDLKKVPGKDRNIHRLRSAADLARIP